MNNEVYKIDYTNTTGYEIDLSIYTVDSDGHITNGYVKDITLKDGESIQLDCTIEDINPLEIVVHNEDDCEVYISNGYTTNDGVKIVEIYIN